ncbi:hypothetical protein [Pseudoalteromonas sp. PPB1]|uniref:hypothetical protein n=1 Tax=Pseudoalteromonas sp. PPB1 TaxID=2756136 RepID=UPI00189190A8|nr:hypothetical protein [Pseudoalteromonas sp. PPB1]
MSKSLPENDGRTIASAIALACLFFLPLIAATKAAIETYLFLLVGIVVLAVWKRLRVLILEDCTLKLALTANYLLALVICSFSIFYEYHIPMLLGVGIYMFAFKSKLIGLSDKLSSDT